jgi:hypothetical protein
MPHVANQQAVPTSLHSSYQDMSLYTSRPASLRSSFQELPNLVVTQPQSHSQPASLRSSFSELPNVVMTHTQQQHTQPSSPRSSFNELPNAAVSQAPNHSQPSSLRASFNDAQPPRIVPHHQPNLRASCNDISRLQQQDQSSVSGVWANASLAPNFGHSKTADSGMPLPPHQDQGAGGRRLSTSGSFWHKSGVGTGVGVGNTGDSGEPGPGPGRGKSRGPVGMVLTHSTCQSAEGRQLHVHRSVLWQAIRVHDNMPIDMLFLVIAHAPAMCALNLHHTC